MRTPLDGRLDYKVFDEPKPASRVSDPAQQPKEKPMPTPPCQPEALQFAAWIGIDWADQEHAVCVVDAATGRSDPSTLAHEPGAIEDWAMELHNRFPGPIAVCLEQSKGALLYALMKFDFLVLYPINPKQLACYREALAPSGAKDDPVDAQLLVDFLRRYHDRLRPWRPDDQATRLISILNEDRRGLIDLRTELTNRLQSRLKLYFPLVLELFRGRTKLYAPVVCELLLRWGTLKELQQTDPAEIKALFTQYHLHQKSIDQNLTKIAQAKPLSDDEAIVRSGRLQAQGLAQQLVDLADAIARCEAELEKLMETHPDAPLFTQLPGAGDALAPRLLAAFGTDRERIESASDMQSYSGIAPVTRRSGKSQFVAKRWACPNFLRQTFHEFARCSIAKSVWAAAYYRMQRDRGKKHHAAVRALAFKWIRILYACWKNHTLYNEFNYLQQLESQQSPLLAYVGTNHVRSLPIRSTNPKTFTISP
jgi:transposase